MNDNQRLEAVTFEVNQRCFKDIFDTPDFQKYVIGPVAAIGAVIRSCVATTNDTSDAVLVNAFREENLVRPEFFWSPPEQKQFRTFGRITIRLGENGSSGVLITPEELQKLGNGISAVFDGLPVNVVREVFRSARFPEPSPARVQAPAPGGSDEVEFDIPH